MNSEVEDSDATVGPDVEEPMSDDGDTEAAAEKSPSFLNTQVAAVFSSSGGQSEESSLPMSPELPLTSGSKAQVSRTNSMAPAVVPVPQPSNSGETLSSSGSQRVESSEPEALGMEIEDVARQQLTLLCSLQQAESSTHMYSSEEVKKMKNKTTEIEASLKEISTANQTERKRLAMAYSSLSQPPQSQTSMVEGSQNIRQRLLSLADRQKTLLQCFKTQKDVTDKLEKVLAQCKLWADSKVVSSVDSKKSRKKLDSSVVPPGISAAIPNILQHLKPQPLKATPTQSQTQLHPLTSTQLAAINTQPTNTNTQHLPHNLVQMPQKIAPPSVTAGVQLHRKPATHLHVPPTALGTAHLQIPSQPQAPPQVVAQAQSQSQALAVPVPLVTLIQHHFLEPGKDCLSCVLMGCEFKCSLLESGALCSLTGVQYKTPNQWVSSCWSQLGQHKYSVKTKFAYKNIMYRGTPLMTICEQFNHKQVSSYHRKEAAGRCTLPYSNICVPGKTVTSQPTSCQKTALSIHDLLVAGQVFMVDRDSAVSLDLPEEFWGKNHVSLTSQLVWQLEKDLEW